MKNFLWMQRAITVADNVGLLSSFALDGNNDGPWKPKRTRIKSPRKSSVHVSVWNFMENLQRNQANECFVCWDRSSDNVVVNMFIFDGTTVRNTRSPSNSDTNNNCNADDDLITKFGRRKLSLDFNNGLEFGIFYKIKLHVYRFLCLSLSLALHCSLIQSIRWE